MDLKFGIKYSKKKELRLRFQAIRTEVSATPRVKDSPPLDNKIFCIGFGKTGTTSLELALKDFGYKMGFQPVAEMLVEDWHKGEVDRILNYCHSADAFQDLPFGAPGLFRELDKNFPKSKFILTIRTTPELWFDSVLKFHGKKFSADGKSVPTIEELGNKVYRYKGWPLDMISYLFGYPEIDLYDKEKYIEIYLKHIEDVREYFKDRKNDLLVLDVSLSGSYQKLADFLGIEVGEYDSFPWLNKT
ncbi:MAG: hypothetical protein H6599_02835 [Flavobacteriales bacterium]|nr:hypothetical protein [Flavobacteriales bacterium]